MPRIRAYPAFYPPLRPLYAKGRYFTHAPAPGQFFVAAPYEARVGFHFKKWKYCPFEVGSLFPTYVIDIPQSIMNNLPAKVFQFIVVVLTSFSILILVQIACSNLIGSDILPNSPDWEVLGNTADWGAGMATIVGFFFLWKQLDREREVIEIQTSAQVYNSGMTALNIFIENRELRSYFYDCKPLPDYSEDTPTWNLVMTACEIMCDQWENTFASQSALNANLSNAWITYMKGIYLTSPSLRYFLIQEGYRYEKTFIDLFDERLYHRSTEHRSMVEAFARANSSSESLTSEFTSYRHKATLNVMEQMNSTPKS